MVSISNQNLIESGPVDVGVRGEELLIQWEMKKSVRVLFQEKQP